MSTILVTFKLPDQQSWEKACSKIRDETRDFALETFSSNAGIWTISIKDNCKDITLVRSICIAHGGIIA